MYQYKECRIVLAMSRLEGWHRILSLKPAWVIYGETLFQKAQKKKYVLNDNPKNQGRFPFSVNYCEKAFRDTWRGGPSTSERILIQSKQNKCHCPAFSVSGLK